MPFRTSVLLALLVLTSGSMAAELHVVGLYGPRHGLWGRQQADIVDWPGLATKLVTEGARDTPSPAKQVWELLPAEVQTMLRQPALVRHITGRRLDRTEYAQRRKMGVAFENVLKSRKLYDIEAFAGLNLPDETRELVRRRRELSPLEVRWMNRLLLEAAFPKEIKHRTDDLPDGVTVKVTTADQAVILALTSYEPVQWNIQADEGVKIEKIIVAGFGTQEVVGTEVPVEAYVHDDAPPGAEEPEWFYAWEQETGDYENLQAKLKKLTGLDIATFQGQNRHDGQPVVIDGQRGRSSSR